MRTAGTVRTTEAMRASLHAVNPATHPPNEKPRSPTDGQPSSSSQPVRPNLGYVLSNSLCQVQTIPFNGSARAALKIVGSDQRGHVKSCSCEARTGPALACQDSPAA